MLLRMARHHGLILPGQSSHWERGQIFEVLEKLVQARLTPRDQHTFYVELASVRFARCLGYRSDRIARDLGLNVTLVNWYRGDWEASTPYEPAPVRHIADAEGIAARVQKAYPEERWTAQWEAGAYKADPEAVKAAQLRHKTLSPAHIAAIQQLETQRAYDEELSALANGSKPSRTGYRRPTER